MDGIYRADPGIFRDPRIAALQLDDAERRLPVVGMQDIRIEILRPHQLQHRDGEKGEPFGVVIFPVKRPTLEIIFIVEKIVRHAVLF